MKPRPASAFPRRSHHPDDHVVRDERALIHVALGLAAERGARRHRLTQHVAGRQVRDAPFLREVAGLRALARARRSQKGDSHAQLPYPLERDLDFFRKPS